MKKQKAPRRQFCSCPAGVRAKSEQGSPVAKSGGKRTAEARVVERSGVCSRRASPRSASTTGGSGALGGAASVHSAASPDNGAIK